LVEWSSKSATPKRFPEQTSACEKQPISERLCCIRLLHPIYPLAASQQQLACAFRMFASPARLLAFNHTPTMNLLLLILRLKWQFWQK
jgi:hypothetical protein